MLGQTLNKAPDRSRRKLIFRRIPEQGDQPLIESVVQVMNLLGSTPNGPTLLSIHRPPTAYADCEYLVALVEGAPGWHYHQEPTILAAGLSCAPYV